MSKMTLQLTPEMDAVLDRLAETRGVPKAQALRRAMLLMDYLDEQIADNNDLLIRDPQGELTRLVLESQLSGGK